MVFIKKTFGANTSGGAGKSEMMSNQKLAESYINQSSKSLKNEKYTLYFHRQYLGC